MMAERGENCILTGEFDDSLAEMATRKSSDSLVTIAPDVVRARSAANAARLGLLRLGHGDADDVATLEPLYLRPPAAVERAEAMARAEPVSYFAHRAILFSRSPLSLAEPGHHHKHQDMIAMMKPKLTISSAQPPTPERACAGGVTGIANKPRSPIGQHTARPCRFGHVILNGAQRSEESKLSRER